LGAQTAATPSRTIRIPDRWRPTAAAGLSLLVPGAGHAFVGRPRRGLVFFIPAVAAAVAGVVLYLQGRLFLLELLVQPRWVSTLFAVNVVGLAVRAAAVIDAYRIARPVDESASVATRLRVVIAGLTVAVVAVPHVLVGQYSSDLLDLLDTVFVGEDQITEAAAEAAILAEEAEIRLQIETEAARAAANYPVEQRGVVEVGEAGVLLNMPDGVSRRVTPSFARLEVDHMVPFDERVDRITILLAGGDAGPSRWSLRTDVMIVATVDLTTGKATLFSVSRVLAYFPLPLRWEHAFEKTDEDIWRAAVAAQEAGKSQATNPVPGEFEACLCYPAKVNGLWTFTNGFTQTFPDSVDPGMDALRETLQIAMGLRIDYFALVDMGGFVDLVDAIGGVDVAVKEPMHVRFSPAKEGDDWITIEVEPGIHHLDGRLALAYVRNRSDSNDDVRTRRQRCLLRDVAASADPVTMLLNFPEIADAVRDHTTTNIPLRVLPDLIKVAAGMQRSDVATIALSFRNVSKGLDYRGLPIVDTGMMRSTVARVLAGEGTAAVDAVAALECA